MNHPHALLIVNQKSRDGKDDLSEGIALLQERGIVLTEKYIDDPRCVPDLIRDHAGRVDRIILGGGDGTLNCAAESMIACGLPLGILPLGTANDLARTLGIPPAPLSEACRIIADGRLHAIDVGCVNDTYFFNVANIGLGVRVTHNLNAETKRRWGILGYAHSLVRSLREHRSFRVDITCDGQTIRTRSIQVAVGNGRFYGGGMTIADDAAIDDHRLILYSLKQRDLWKMIVLAPALWLGWHRGRQDVLLLHGRDLEIRTKKPMGVDTDGELKTRTPARFRLLEKAIAVYVPVDGGPGLKEFPHATQ